MRRKGDTGPFRTSAASAYPDRMCRAIVEALFAALDNFRGDVLPSEGDLLETGPELDEVESNGTQSCTSQTKAPVLRFSKSVKTQLEKRLLELKIRTLKDTLKSKLAARDSRVQPLPMPVGDRCIQFKPKWQLTEGIDYIKAGWYGHGDPILTIKSPGRFGRIMMDGGGLCSPGRWITRQ